MLLLKLALRPWKLAPYSQVFSAIAVGILLLLAGFLLWLQEGLKPVLTRLKQEQVITAYLDASSAIPAHKIVDQIQLSLGAYANSAEITLTDSKQFLDHIKESYPELGNELEELGPELPTVIPHYVSITGMLPDSSLEKIRAVSGIDGAESSKDRNRSAVSAFGALRWASRLLFLGLCFALLTGLIHLARTNQLVHRDSSHLLKLLGAGPGALRAPAVLSGLWVGMIGGAVAFVGWMSGGVWLSIQISRLSPLLSQLPTAAPNSFMTGALLFTLGTLIGLLAGIFGCLAQREI